MEVINNYDVHIDSKKRVTLRGARYQFYNVREYDNGCIMLEPRELAIPKEISSRTLSSMDQAIRNFKLGQVSDPVDLSGIEAMKRASRIAEENGLSDMSLDEINAEITDARK